MREPLVTIFCVTYNHTAYVRQALDGFLMQKTDFPFEILVSDDASTDDTAEILRAYAAAHPGRFRLIEQEENRYSKDSRYMARLLFPELRGRYTAICEGDDFWTDEHKLQRQIDWLEAHPDCSLCVTSAWTVNAAGGRIGMIAPYESDCEMPIEDLIHGGGGFIPTASIVTRTAFLRDLPDFYFLSTVGDAPLQLYLASRGKTRWLAAPMCAYRVNAPGSWTVAQLMEDTARPIAMHRSMLDMLAGFDAYTDGRYRAEIAGARTYHSFQIHRLQGDLAALRQPQFAALYAALTWRERLRMLCLKYCPFVIRCYRRLRAKRGF